MEELEAALLKLRSQFIKKYGRNGWKLSVSQTAEHMRLRAEAGRRAISHTQRTVVAEKSFKEFSESIESNIEVRSGARV